MTYPELQIQLNLNPDNRVDVLRNANTCRLTKYGYLFVDQEDGQCYLFDKDGQEDDISKVKKIEDNAFDNAFEDCTSLKSIEIPDSVKSIGYEAFSYCESLTGISIPNSLESIGDKAFLHCKSLKSIHIPDSVKIIGDWAFYGCRSLISISIPDSVKSIGKWAFCYCPSLKEVVFKGKTMDEVKAMNGYPYGYPWGVEDVSIIKTDS